MTCIEFDLYHSCKKRNRAWGSRNASDEARTRTFLDKDGTESLYPNYGYKRKNGTERASDVTTFKGDDNKEWVHGVDDMKPDGKHWVSWKEGVSVGKRRQAMPYSDGWFDFLLPEGTPIPPSLDVKHTRTKKDPDHHSIRLKNQMTKEAYHGVLDTLARNAIARAAELRVTSLYFS